MQSYCDKLIYSSSSLKEKAKSFAQEWKKVFGKTLPSKVSEDYVKHMISMKKKGRFTRKHRGGNHITGAPLDYMTRPGMNTPHGSFTPYIEKGFWNPQPGILKDCGTQQGVVPYSQTGNNSLKGGGILSTLQNGLSSVGTGLSAISFRAVEAQNPQTVQHNIMTSYKGLPHGPGGASYDQAWQPRSITQPATIPLPPHRVDTR
jgi:hypothetical protein